MNKLNVGVIGCGVISEIYMENCTKKFRNLKLVACADILYESALRRAKQFGCKAESIEELLGDPEVEVVLNLTPPASHFNISMKILKAGKHVYTEKPMAANKTECELLLKFAKENNLYIGNAPDCFLGAGLQTCRRLLESGAIGTPFAAQAFMFSFGPENFHPNPSFFYQHGAGPLLDWGPYYISALVALMGPIRKVIALGRSPFHERCVLSTDSPHFGENFPVEVPTYVTSLLEFENDFIATLSISFDMKYPYWESNMPFTEKEIRNMRRNMTMVFQNPYSSLNPRMTILEAVRAPLDIFNIGSKSERYEKCRDILKYVGLEEHQFYRYPHEFSGGQRQRVVIARAMISNPDFVVCDEPVSALDVSVRAQVLNLFNDIQKERDVAYLFISHDLSVVKHISDRIAVMYLGKIVELSPKDDLYENPKHPYTRALLSAIPIPDANVQTKRIILQGDLPSPMKPPEGCGFNTRCKYATERCRRESPEFKYDNKGHGVACHMCEEVQQM